MSWITYFLEHQVIVLIVFLQITVQKNSLISLIALVSTNQRR